MRRLLDVSAGVITGLGGFLELGAIAAATTAGAEYGFGLVWAFVLGGLCLVLLVEMSSRFAAVTEESVVGAMRARFGAELCMVPLLGILLVMMLVLSTEISGLAVALELGTGLPFRLWTPTAAFAVWLLLWTARFRIFDYLVAVLGFIGLAFLIVALWSGPPWRALAAGLVPHLPASEPARWGFLAAVALGASISPSLLFFYSSGLVANRWTRKHLRSSRIVPILGMSLRTLLALSVVVIASRVFHARGAHVEDAFALPELFAQTLGSFGYRAFLVTLGFACWAAAAEVGLVIAYLVAQTVGWNFTAKERPRENARFAVVYTVAIVIAAIVPLSGAEPLRLALVAMALTALTLPLAVFPFLVLMSDERYLGHRTNRTTESVLVAAIVALAVVLAIVTIPHELRGG